MLTQENENSVQYGFVELYLLNVCLIFFRRPLCCKNTYLLMLKMCFPSLSCHLALFTLDCLLICLQRGFKIGVHKFLISVQSNQSFLNIFWIISGIFIMYISVSVYSGANIIVFNCKFIVYLNICLCYFFLYRCSVFKFV